MKLFFAIARSLLIAGGLFYATASSPSAVSTDLDYFKGTWVVAIRNKPQETFRWTVKEDMGGGWLMGVVEKDGKKISTDFWRQNGDRLERYAFTADGTFVNIQSSGWQSGRMVLSGTASDKTGETKIRETITRVSERRFNALWEMLNEKGEWVVFADEICTK